jgi:hypothetical protein
MLSYISLGANQLLKPASTTPRSYGRRHRSWHYGHVHATHNERRRRNGLYTTIKYMRGASGNGMGTTIKHLRRTTIGAAGNGLGAKMMIMMIFPTWRGVSLSLIFPLFCWPRLKRYTSLLKTVQEPRAGACDLTMGSNT